MNNLPLIIPWYIGNIEQMFSEIAQMILFVSWQIYERVMTVKGWVTGSGHKLDSTGFEVMNHIDMWSPSQHKAAHDINVHII